MIKLAAISTGKIENLNYHPTRPMRSALNKQPIQDKIWLSTLGFETDEQAYKDHGGPHKAVCAFNKASYHMYANDLAVLPEYAMFGENLTFEDYDEVNVDFGNQYQLGDAIIEVSEIREPCWKIQAKYQINDLVKRMSQSGKTGFYFRVLQEGYVHPDDNLILIDHADERTRLSVQQLNHLYYNDRKNIEMLAYALENPYLSPNRLAKLEKMYQRALKQ